MYKGMHYLEKMKHLDPNMTGAFHQLAKVLYYEIKGKAISNSGS